VSTDVKPGAAHFAKDYLRRLQGVMDGLPLERLDRIVAAIEAAYHAGQQIFIIGNGGSAATASHMMNDLSKSTIARAGGGAWPRIRAIALTDNVPLMTAWANDNAFTEIFSEPLQNLARPGDLLVAISASGKSANILTAVRAARQLGLTIVGLSGFGGGELAEEADVALIVPSDHYGQVEDVHMMLNHIISDYLYQRLRELQAGCQVEARDAGS